MNLIHILARKKLNSIQLVKIVTLIFDNLEKTERCFWLDVMYLIEFVIHYDVLTRKVNYNLRFGYQNIALTEYEITLKYQTN